jgi:hypothetical protein
VALRIGKVWWLSIGGVALAALLAYAWIDGGMRPVQPIAEAVNVPGTGAGAVQ